MSAFFSVIQYVPDPIADERVNAGVLVFTQDRATVRFVQTWDRIAKFGNRDIAFLKEFAKEFQIRIDGQFGPIGEFPESRLNQTMVDHVAKSFRGSIQFTKPRGSLLTIEDLIEDTTRRFLAADRPPSTRPLTKHYIKRMALDALRIHLLQRGGPDALKLLSHKSAKITGEVEEHSVSLKLENGVPMLGAEVFSFAGADTKIQEKEVRATAWAFGDIKKRNRDIALAAIVLSGDGESPALQGAERVLDSAGAEVVHENEIGGWADRVVATALSRTNH